MTFLSNSGTVQIDFLQKKDCRDFSSLWRSVERSTVCASRLAYRRATDRLEIQMTAEFSDKMGRPQVKPTTFDLSDLLSTMILSLPEQQQEVVQLAFFKGLSQRDIAAQKSISLGTVKTRLQLAQKKLLNQLDADSEQNLRSQKVLS